MTEVKKTVKKADAAKKSSAAPKKDAYDELIELAEGKAAPKKTAAKPKSGTAKSPSAKSSGSSKRASAKSAKVEPGIGMVDSTAGKTKKPKSDATPAKVSSSKKTASGEKKPAAAEKTSSAKKVSSAEKKPASGAKRSASAKKTAAVEPGVGRKPAARRQAAVLLVENSDGRDPYDIFLDAAEKPGKKRKRKKGQSALTAVLSVCILCVLALGLWQYTEYRSFLVMREAVERQYFYEGTLVEGVDVSQMTLEQAVQHWEQNVEPAYSQRKVTLSNGAEFTAAELGYTSDYAMVLNNAWNAGRSGSLEERYNALSSRLQQPVSYTVTRRAYGEENVDACVSAIAAQIDRPAEDAKIASFDTETYEFTFTDAVTGSQVDTQALKTGMIQALEAGGGTVELIVRAIQPQATKEEVAAQYGMITYAVTNASSSSSNRLSNIKLALSIIDGVKLAPGETFSFNDTVGKRTTERGFKVATAYSAGEVTEDVGGGICQVSTTLFNAAVKADLEIVERHNHSLTVAYVDKGKDASVNWNSQDLRFTNTSDDDIYICCLLTDDKRVRIGIFGKLLPDGETITVEGVTTEEIPYETEHQQNYFLPSGTTNVLQAGKPGYKATAYKIRWDKNGNQISKEVLCKSTYKATKEIIEYGP